MLGYEYHLISKKTETKRKKGAEATGRREKHPSPGIKSKRHPIIKNTNQRKNDQHSFSLTHIPPAPNFGFRSQASTATSSARKYMRRGIYRPLDRSTKQTNGSDPTKKTETSISQPPIHPSTYKEEISKRANVEIENLGDETSRETHPRTRTPPLIEATAGARPGVLLSPHFVDGRGKDGFLFSHTCVPETTTAVVGLATVFVATLTLIGHCQPYH